MKRFLLSIASFVALVTTGWAQQTIYVCEGFTYDVHELKPTDEIRFSTDGKEVSIGNYETYELDEIDSITFAEPQFPRIDIVYNGTSATVNVGKSVKGVTYTIKGAVVTLTSTTTTDEYLYTVSGTSTNGSLIINGEYKLTVELAGLTLTNPNGPAIDIECGKRIGVILKEGTTNTLTDGKNGTHKGAFYTKGHPEFEGKGTLNVTGNTKHAICAKEYLQIKKSTGYINILSAVSDGIHCGKGNQNDDNCFFEIRGGVVTVNNAGSDCIDADDYGCMMIEGGVLNLNVSATDGAGLKCDSIIRMSGGDINIKVTGTLSEGIRTNYSAYFDGGAISVDVNSNGSKGIRAKRCSKTTDTVLNGGHLYFGGTDVNMNIAGSTYTADGTECVGIRADRNFTQTSGEITLTVTSNDATGLVVKGEDNRSGGTLVIK
ncbi:MAG: carbohydrate-binding domain-containing protein [Bacteroidaceae bacterium]|nr:carbohydrate-binding domain-containing protein [Bacteroidaceae bacterium]